MYDRGGNNGEQENGRSTGISPSQRARLLTQAQHATRRSETLCQASKYKNNGRRQNRPRRCRICGLSLSLPCLVSSQIGPNSWARSLRLKTTALSSVLDLLRRLASQDGLCRTSSPPSMYACLCRPPRHPRPPTTSVLATLECPARRVLQPNEQWWQHAHGRTTRFCTACTSRRV